MAAPVAPLDSWAQRVYPFRYLTCPVCKAPPRRFCVALSGRVVDGRPDGVEVPLERPHTKRRISKARSPRR